MQDFIASSTCVFIAGFRHPFLVIRLLEHSCGWGDGSTDLDKIIVQNVHSISAGGTLIIRGFQIGHLLEIVDIPHSNIV